MLDQYQREINYLRLAITDHCDLRCFYCRPQKFAVHDNGEFLTVAEYGRLVEIGVSLGITRFKITGGEPLQRAECVQIVDVLKRTAGVEQVTMTTNGTLFTRYAEQLQRAGLDSVTFSLDTVDEQEYRDWTGGNLRNVLLSIEKAAALGMRFKFNTVLHNRTSLESVRNVLYFAEQYGAIVRFIEQMPLAGAPQDADCLTKEQLGALLGPLVRVDGAFGNGPAVYYKSQSYAMRIGFIEPLHGKFCVECNRVRVTPAGQLKACLYAPPVLDIKTLLRSGASDVQVREALHDAIWEKPKEHGFESAPARFSMSEVGG